jgi:hypothetical protein
MNEDHPMYERLMKQLELKGWTIERATDDALMAWICNQEMAEALKPRVWETVTVQQLRELAARGEIELRFRPDDDLVEIHHHHPMFGLILTDPAALQEVWNEALYG